MKNKRQISVLATVQVTVEYDTEIGLSEEMIEQEVKNNLDAALVTGGLIQWFDDHPSTEAVVQEVSVHVNTNLPTNYRY